MAAMMARLFLALAGVMALILFAIVWADLPRFGVLLGPVADTPLAAATLRADIGGFFLAWAAGALIAAWRSDPTIAALPIGLLAAAFCGRLVTYVATPDPAIIQPMAIEAALCVLLFFARRAIAGQRPARSPA